MLIPIVIAGLVIEVLCIRIASLGDIMQHIPQFSLMYSTAFIAYLFAVFLVSKNAALSGKSSNISKNITWIILVFSLIFRLTLLPATPSNDIFRYLWEGKIQLHGINPYSQPPVSLNLEHLRDNFFSGISHKHLTAIYPPLTLMVFAIADFISHSFVSIKSAFLLFVMLALYLYSIRKNAKSVVSISLAVMSKFVSIIIVPFLIPRKKFRYLAILFLVIILLYLPYCSAVKGLFSTLFQFGTQYRYNDSIHFLIFYVSLGSPFISKIITSSIFGTMLLYLYKKYLDEAYFNTGLLGEDTILRFAFLAVGTLLILAPTVHPWYLTWIVPFLCFYHNRAWLVLTGTVVFYYFMNYPLFSKLIEYNNEWVWQEVHWLKLPEYLPFYFF